MNYKMRVFIRRYSPVRRLERFCLKVNDNLYHNQMMDAKGREQVRVAIWKYNKRMAHIHNVFRFFKIFKTSETDRKKMKICTLVQIPF